VDELSLLVSEEDVDELDKVGDAAGVCDFVYKYLIDLLKVLKFKTSDVALLFVCFI